MQTLFSHTTHLDPTTSLAFILLTLLAANNAPQSATATPLPGPFLDFLYPSYYTANLKKSNALSLPSPSSNTRPEYRPSTPPGQPPPATAEASVRALKAAVATQYLRKGGQYKEQERRSAEQKQRPRRRRRASLQRQPPPPPTRRQASANPSLAKRSVKSRPVPVKYESIDAEGGGWVLADTWDLHGHSRRADAPIPNADTDVPSTINTDENLSLQNLDTTGTPNTDTSSSDPNMQVTPEGLQLPSGWQNNLDGRHDSYNPIIVAVFAVILVMSILATIGLCRWRARKLKRLRDLERLEREREGSDGEDNNSSSERNSDSSSRFSGKDGRRKRKKNTGSSSAIRKRFARFRRRHRARRSGNIGERGGASDADDRPRPQVIQDESESATASNALTRDRSRTSILISIPREGAIDDSSIPQETSNNLTESAEETPPSATENERERPRMIINITNSNSEIIPPISNCVPNAEPPAYPTRRTRTHAMTEEEVNPSCSLSLSPPPPLQVSPEKAPIPGLEAEYDDRDLASYSSAITGTGSSSADLWNAGVSHPVNTSRSSAPPTRRPGHVRLVEDAANYPEALNVAATGEEEEEQVPSFQPFAHSLHGERMEAGTSVAAYRVAAGAALRAHVATDDKELLERLRGLADEPALEIGSPLSSSAPLRPLLGNTGTEQAMVPTPPSALAPSLSEVEQWELERQIKLAHGVTTSTIIPTSISMHFNPSSLSLTTPAEPANGFPALPLPPPPTRSMSDSGDVGYGLGAVWSGLTTRNVIAPSSSGGPSMPLGSSTTASGMLRLPSAPPLDVPSLLPSAPPPLHEDDLVGAIGLPSAPPAWDEEEADEVDQSMSPTGTATHREGLSADAHLVTDLNNVPGVVESRAVSLQQSTPPSDAVPIHGDVEGDGADSTISTPPDRRSGWSVTFSMRPEEGAGLPRYEP